MMCRPFFRLLLLSLLLACRTEDTSEIDPRDGMGGSDSGIKGSGLASDPYQLTTAAELDVFLRTNLSGSYLLMTDIDLTTYIDENYGLDGWLPINGLEGTFDGGGYTISGLRINRPTMDYVGFFGRLGNGSNSTTTTMEISNLNLEIASSASVTGNSWVGALVGFADDGLRISNVQVAGADANAHVESTASTNTTSRGRSGGLIGLADRCIIIQCVSLVDVVSNGGGRIGGLIGMTNTTTVDQCYATGDVYAQSDDVGGLIGYAHNSGSLISNSYATGDVWISGSAVDDIGSFVGATHSSFVPLRCYATGDIVIDAPSIGSYGYFSGDGDGGEDIFGSTAQTILDGSDTDLRAGVVAEDGGFKLINPASSTCTDFAAFDTSIWSCTDGSFPTLKSNSN